MCSSNRGINGDRSRKGTPFLHLIGFLVHWRGRTRYVSSLLNVSTSLKNCWRQWIFCFRRWAKLCMGPDEEPLKWKTVQRQWQWIRWGEKVSIEEKTGCDLLVVGRKNGKWKKDSQLLACIWRKVSQLLHPRLDIQRWHFQTIAQRMTFRVSSHGQLLSLAAYYASLLYQWTC